MELIGFLICVYAVLKLTVPDNKTPTIEIQIQQTKPRTVLSQSPPKSFQDNAMALLNEYKQIGRDEQFNLCDDKVILTIKRLKGEKP